MKQKIFFLFILFSVGLFSQQKYAKEFSFLNDNDLYISPNQDRYYTNGMFFSYRYLSKKTPKNIQKKIFEVQLGHHMYTPFKATVQQNTDHDRPFAGYLFGSFGIQRFYKNETILKTTLQLGVLGPSAYSKPLQDFIHEIYGYKKAIGWKHQIANTIGVNFKIDYIKILDINILNVEGVFNKKDSKKFLKALTRKTLYEPLTYQGTEYSITNLTSSMSLNMLFRDE